jgi:hypothetical protein
MVLDRPCGRVVADMRNESTVPEMDESKKITLLNIDYLQQLLGTEIDQMNRETIARLLAEQQAKLREIERKERGT